MAHGQEDFGMYAKKETIFSISDMGELAARLGSIATFDRRGNVILVDGFEDGVGLWTDTYTGGAGTWDQSASSPNRGGFCGKLVTAAGSGKVASVRHSLAYPSAEKYGFELAFKVDAGAEPFELRIELSDGTYMTTYKVRYYNISHKLTLVDSGDTERTLDASLTLVTGYWNKIKLVVDPATAAYVRLLLNAYSFDPSAYSGKQAAVTNAYYVNNYAIVTSGIGLGTTMYLDDAIFTQNEP